MLEVNAELVTAYLQEDNNVLEGIKEGRWQLREAPSVGNTLPYHFERLLGETHELLEALVCGEYECQETINIRDRFHILPITTTMRSIDRR